jgi:hypothetical protein
MTRLLLAAALSLALAGCSLFQGMNERLPRHPSPGPAGGEYAALREAASRHDSLYDGLVHRADLNGTWLSPAVRLAGTRQLAEWQSWTPGELEAALKADQAAAAKGEEFVLALYTAERKHNDLDVKPSVWHVEIDDGQRVAVASTVEVLTADATTQQLFPYVGPFDVVYRIRVRWDGPPLEGRRFVLRLAGAVGKLELDFGADGRRAPRPHVAP